MIAPSDRVTLAPRWHTALLVALIVCVAVAGTLLSASTLATPVISGDATAASGAHRLVAAYLPAVVVNLCLVVYVSRIGRSTNVFLSLLGALPRSPRAVARDLTIAFSGFVLIEACEVLAARLRSTSVAVGPRLPDLLPTTTAEKLAWVAFAVTVGVCEEVMYRGYLQTQLRAFARSAAAGVTLQAILFGLAHLDQGVFTAARFAVYGVGFGGLALWRRSLIPGILCHVAIDVFGGLLANS